MSRSQLRCLTCDAVQWLVDYSSSVLAQLTSAGYLVDHKHRGNEGKWTGHVICLRYRRAPILKMNSVKFIHLMYRSADRTSVGLLVVCRLLASY